MEGGNGTIRSTVIIPSKMNNKCKGKQNQTEVETPVASIHQIHESRRSNRPTPEKNGGERQKRDYEAPQAMPIRSEFEKPLQ